MKVSFSWSPGESQAKPSFRWDSNMNKQTPGYALLLVLLLLSIFISGASALARIVVLNLRQVRFVDQAIVASSAASSGIEYGLYQFRKVAPGNIAAIKKEDKSVGVAKVKVTAELGMDNNLKIAENDVAVLNIPVNSGIKSLTINSWNDSCDDNSWLEINKLSWPLTVANNEVPPEIWRQPYSNAPIQIEIPLDIQNKLTQVRIKALYCDVSNVIIESDPSPWPSRVIIKSVGEYQGTKQAQQISTLEKEPLTGLFDYAVFSECSLNNKNSIECP